MNIFDEGTFRPDVILLGGKKTKVYIDGVNQVILTQKEYAQAKNRYKVYKGII